MIDPGSFLLDWCCFLFQAEPAAIQGVSSDVMAPSSDQSAGPDFESFTAEFPGGGLAQIAFGRYHRASWGDATKFLPQAGFQVYAERGAAWLELPDRIQWSDNAGTHEERLPLEPTVGEVLNEHFHRLVRGDHALAPTIHDALAVARWVTDLCQSQREGKKIVRPTPGS